MTESTGIIKSSLLQKAMEEREESLTAQAQDARIGDESSKASCHKSKSSSIARAGHEQAMHELHRLAAEFKEWSEEAERLLLKSKLEIERLEQGCKDSFDAGRAAGRLEMAGSEEYRAAIREARLSGVRDYLKSPMFELTLAAKAAEHEEIGFKKCQSQVLMLDGFKKGFNLGLLDSAAKDGNLESRNATGDHDPECGSLGEGRGREVRLMKGLII